MNTKLLQAKFIPFLDKARKKKMARGKWNDVTVNSNTPALPLIINGNMVLDSLSLSLSLSLHSTQFLLHALYCQLDEIHCFLLLNIRLENFFFKLCRHFYYWRAKNLRLVFSDIVFAWEGIFDKAPLFLCNSCTIVFILVQVYEYFSLFCFLKYFW